MIWGTRMVRTGVTRAFGAGLRRALAAGTQSRVSAFAMGVVVTGLLQSSTATALMTVSFAARNMIAVAPALAVMLGADVGTTLVAQVLSFDLGWLSPVLILAGIVSFMSSDGGRPRHLGRVGIGLGLMLLALKLIIAASGPLRDAPALAVVLAPLSAEPVLAIILTALLTWLAHSSLAVVLLVMSLAVGGIVELPLAFAMVLGANVGGAIAPVFVSLRAPAVARRVPLGNLAMRFLGCALLLPLLGLVTPYIQVLDSGVARQVVNFHTAFNLAVALLFWPLIDPLAAILARILPEKQDGDDVLQPRHLDEGALDTPAVAIASAARETLRMGEVVEQMLVRSIDALRHDNIKLVHEIEAMDDDVDRLHEAIKLYLTRVSRTELDQAEGRRHIDVLTFTTNLEHIGDIIDKNLMELANKKIKKRLAFSEPGFAEICDFHAHVVENMGLAFSIFMAGDVRMARQLLSRKVTMRDAEQRTAAQHLARLSEGRPESIETSSLHEDIIRDLKRINNHLTSVAYPILDAAGELHETRLRQASSEASPPGHEAEATKGSGRTAGD